MLRQVTLELVFSEISFKFSQSIMDASLMPGTMLGITVLALLDLKVTLKTEY